MTLLVCYPSKKALKECKGQRLRFRETSAFGQEYRADGTFSVAYRPLIWPHSPDKGREFFARVTMKAGLIERVE
jgi:hypothetical protein